MTFLKTNKAIRKLIFNKVIKLIVSVNKLISFREEAQARNR